MTKNTKRRIALLLCFSFTLATALLFSEPDNFSEAADSETEAATEAYTEQAEDVLFQTNISTEQDTAQTDEETDKTISTDSYESSDMDVTFADLTYQLSDGTEISYEALTQGLTYTYNYSRQYPNLTIYYNGTRLYTSISKTYMEADANGAYTECDSYDIKDAGSYRLVLSPVSSFTYYDSEASVYYTCTVTDTLTIPFVITQKNINDADIVCSSISDQTYDGDPLYPDLIVTHMTNDTYGYTLSPNVSYEYDSVYNSESGEYEYVCTPDYNDTYDYTIEYINNTMAGQGTIRITGVGNYTGTRDITFRILCDVSCLTFSGYKDTIYTGKEITFSGFAAYEGSRPLTNNVDYTVTYSNNKDYGEAVITVTGLGYYTGTTDIYFGIVPKKVTGISISSPKKLQAKITWKKCKGAQGFEISRYNTKKKTYEVIAILTDGNWQVYQDTASSLKNNVKYKYRIRPFVSSSDGTRRYYGAAATKKGKVTKAYKELNIPIYTGCPDVDYAAEVICKKVIKKGMSQQQKVKALYDWVVDNCTHDKDYGSHKTVYSYKKNAKKASAYNTKIWKKIYTGKAECNFDGYTYNSAYDYWDYYGSDDYGLIYPDTIGSVNGKGQFYRTYEVFQTHKGGCSYITRLFKALINHAGMECTLIDGNYVNRDGSKMYHYWCFIRVNKKCAWYDVDVATSNKSYRYTWYKKGAKFWHTCHEWTPKYNENIPSYLN